MYISQLIAASAVSQVLAGGNLTLALPKAQSQFPQALPQQRGAGADLSYGTLRFYGEIEAYLQQLLQKPLTDERIHALLAVALYQLLHDEADHFTVVNQAVNAVAQLKRPAVKPWAKGLVNAILRNFLRNKSELENNIKTSEVARYSYPRWWIQALKKQYPDDWQDILQTGNQHPPMSLRVNARKQSTDDYLAMLATHHIEAKKLGLDAIMLSKPVPVEQLPGFVDGLISVQDYGAQLAARLLDLNAGMKVLDACCAPGGKTGHILELADVALTAIDQDEQRLARVDANLKRLQLSAQLMVADAGDPQALANDGPFDRILADVPCSASGIVRRHVDIKWLRREQDIASFSAQQARILRELWQLLAKGGKLLYVTCSIFHDENQGQIDRFLQQHPDAKQLAITDTVLANMHTSPTQHGQLIPCKEHDGFFYALLQKQ